MGFKNFCIAMKSRGLYALHLHGPPFMVSVTMPPASTVLIASNAKSESG